MELFLNSNIISVLYKPRFVYSIYYDTYNYKFYRLSEEGVSPRFKIRIRSYDKSFQNKNLEIKKTSDYFREKKFLKNINLQSISFNQFLMKNGINEVIKPVLLVTYLRYYYQKEILNLADMDVVLIRQDPPFDMK